MFLASGSRYQIESFETIIPEAKINEHLTPIGYHCNKISCIINSYKPILKLMNDQLPKISAGPIVSLSTDFKKVSSLNEILIKSGNEIDKLVPQELQISELFTEAFNHLGQFNQYIPMLITKDAPSMASYVPALQQSLSLVSETLDKLLNMLVKILESDKEKQNDIKIEDKSFAHYCVAANNIAELLDIDLHFLSAYETVYASTQISNIENWSHTLTDVSEKLREAAPTNVEPALPSLKQISTSIPSLFTIYNFVNGQVKDANLLTGFAKHVMQYMNLVFAKVGKPVAELVSQQLKKVMDLVFSNGSIESFKEITESLLNIFSEYASTDYIDNSSEANTTISSIKSMMTISQDQTEIVDCSLTLARCISMALLSDENSKIIDDTLKDVIAKFMNAQLSLLKGYTTGVTDTYTKNISVYNENSLSYINFHTKAIESIDSINLDKESFCEDVQKLFASSGYLPYAIENILNQADDNDREIFSKFMDDINKSSTQISAWFNQLINIISVKSQIGAWLGVNAVNAARGQLELTEDVSATVNQYANDLNNMPRYLTSNQNHGEYVNILNKISSIIKPEDEGMAALARALINTIVSEENELPENIKKLSATKTQDDYVSNIGAIAFNANPIITDAQQHYDDSFAYKFSHFYSEVTRLCGVLEHAPDVCADLKQFPQSIKTSLNTIWPLITNFDASSRQMLSNYVTSLSQMMNEFQSAVESLPQPMLMVDIPAALRQFRKLESSISALPSAALRITAANLMDLLKDNKSENAMYFLTKWFEKASESDNSDMEEAQRVLLNAIKKVKETGTFDNEVLDALVKCSVNATKSMADMSGDELEFMEKLNNKLNHLINEYIENPNEKTLDKIQILYDQMKNHKKYMNIPENEKEETLEVILRDIADKLSQLREGKCSPEEVCKALKNLETYAYFNDKELYDEFKDLIDESIEKILNGETDLPDLINKIVEHLKKMHPDRYDELNKLTDQDEICDAVYDRAEAFREYSNVILRAAKQGDVPEEVINNALAKMSTLASETATITLRSMENGGYEKTSQIGTFAKNSNDVFSAMSKFEEMAKTLKDKEGDITMELRRLARTMAKKIDYFINTVERPLPAVPSSEFDSLKNAFFHMLSKTNVTCSRVVARISNAPLKEIFDSEREYFKDLLNENRKNLREAAEALYAAAVEPEKSQFMELFNEYDKMIEDAQNLLLENERESKKKIAESFEFCPKVIESANALTDHITILPDPDAAGKIPDDFPVPPMPSSAPPAQEVLKQLIIDLENLNKEVDTFGETYADKSNEETVEATLKMREFAEKYAATCASMAFATTDPRLQVEEQTTLHQFASAFTSLQNGVRAKLMIDPTAASQISESMASVKSTATHFREIAEQFIKQQEEQALKQATEEVEDIQANDAVTAELQATASAIEEMSAKLSEFGSQFGGVEDVQIDASMLDDEEDEDEEKSKAIDLNNVDSETYLDLDSYIKFIIMQAKAILKAAGDMLKRAMQITANLIAEYGQIQNEKMMMNSAQDLTEAAGLIMVAAEMLIKGTAGEDPEFKVIAAARIVKGSVAQLVAQVLVQGGDSEGIMNMHVKTVRFCSNQIVRKSEIRVALRVQEQEKGKVLKGNKTVQKLNAQTVVNENRQKLQDSEKTLYQYRKKVSRK